MILKVPFLYKNVVDYLQDSSFRRQLMERLSPGVLVSFHFSNVSYIYDRPCMTNIGLRTIWWRHHFLVPSSSRWYRMQPGGGGGGGCLARMRDRSALRDSACLVPRWREVTPGSSANGATHRSLNWSRFNAAVRQRPKVSRYRSHRMKRWSGQRPRRRTSRTKPMSVVEPAVQTSPLIQLPSFMLAEWKAVIEWAPTFLRLAQQRSSA